MRRCTSGGIIESARSSVVSPLFKQEAARTMRVAHGVESASLAQAPSPNQALQRTAMGIKCSAAGGRAESAHERWRARVLKGRRAVAELSS